MEDSVIWIVLGMGMLVIFISISINNSREKVRGANDSDAEVDSLPKNLEDEIKSLVGEGKKIKAIKRYRMVTGLGLKEAKDYIDRIGKP